MLDIDAPIPKPALGAELEPLAKAHPAASLLKSPGWECSRCKHRNPITAAFCEKCPS